MKEAVEETNSPMRTEKVLSDKYDLNHANAVPSMPTHSYRREIKIPWSKVSNAAERSNNTKIAQFPESVASNRSFDTLSNAVSVL